MNRLSGLNGYDVKKFSSSNPDILPGDSAGFGIESNKTTELHAGNSVPADSHLSQTPQTPSSGDETESFKMSDNPFGIGEQARDYDKTEDTGGPAEQARLQESDSSVNYGESEQEAHQGSCEQESAIFDGQVYHAKVNVFGDSNVPILSTAAFDAIFGSGSSKENELPGPKTSANKKSSTLFFSPLHYEPRYDYPLIIWLHGCGSSERELEELMPYISIRNYVAVAPRGTKAFDPNGHRYSWAHSPASIALAEELIFDAIENASKRYNISRKKIFLAGRGAGGTMAWRMALRNPKQFAGCVSLGGVFPKSYQPLALLKDLRHLRSLWMVGERSSSCGIDTVVDCLPLLHAAKLQVAIRQYNCGDDLYADMFSDMNRWLMEIVTNQVSSPVEDSCVWGGLTGLN